MKSYTPQIKLISYTVPSEELVSEGILDMNDLIAFCARVSNPKNQYNTETAEKLIDYLIKNSHWSPLEMADMTLEINSTRDIIRQILRHRSFSCQEFSLRYAEPAFEDFVFRDARSQDSKNRQNSIDDLPYEIQYEWKLRQEKLILQQLEDYQWARKNNIAKECARVIFSEGCTPSRVYMKGSLRSWIHYCHEDFGVRRGNGTQKEHVDIAYHCAKIISGHFKWMK